MINRKQAIEVVSGFRFPFIGHLAPKVSGEVVDAILALPDPQIDRWNELLWELSKLAKDGAPYEGEDSEELLNLLRKRLAIQDPVHEAAREYMEVRYSQPLSGQDGWEDWLNRMDGVDQRLCDALTDERVSESWCYCGRAGGHRHHPTEHCRQNSPTAIYPDRYADE